jgi:hypothetical protein
MGINPGDLLASGNLANEAERARMVELIGLLAERLQNGAAVDCEPSRMLIGLLSARLHEVALAERLTTMQTHIGVLQQEVAALQRLPANRFRVVQ